MTTPKITPETLSAVLHNPDEWTLERAPMKLHTWDYDDTKYGTIVVDYLELDEAPDTLRTVTMELYVHVDDTYTDYTWAVPPANIELVWTPADPVGDDDIPIHDMPELLSDLELVSWKIDIVNKNKIGMDITYKYHTEIN